MSDYKDITQMDEDALLDWQAEHPREYAGNLYRQIRSELREDFRREQAENDRLANQSGNSRHDNMVRGIADRISRGRR